MLQIFKDLLDTLADPAPESTETRDRALQLATAVLLVEVMRVDPLKVNAERLAVAAMLQEQFTLPAADLAKLLALAEQTAETASDYYQFTSRLNDSLSHAQKISIVENMWQVAYAGKRLDVNENALIGKIAELLYVTQGEYIGAKMRAKEAAGLI